MRAMKLATFNINNINRRLPNLLRWLKDAKPDVDVWRAVDSEGEVLDMYNCLPLMETNTSSRCHRTSGRGRPRLSLRAMMAPNFTAERRTVS